jgi:protein-L-isoaspartate(D-aspartate) O-methyltransferase
MIVPWLSLGNAEVSDQRVDQGAEERRTLMVEEQIEARGIRDARILEAMRTVPRHRFVPDALSDQAYGDYPLPIGWEQTISQPYIVALMCDLIGAQGGERILEIGTGSGYHAAVLSRLVREVYTIEIVEPLGRRADETLRSLGYDNVHVRLGDGYRGWPEAAPFDAIVLTAAPAEVPQPLLDQLKVGGRMILPLGRHTQDLVVITRTGEGFERRSVAAVRFVPMTGEAQGDTSP